MTKEITMPRLSETMIDGKILSWHKKPNDKVKKGDVIAEVETDKANMEVEAVDSGVISEILIPEGQKAKVGDTIAVLNGKVQQRAEAPKQELMPKAEEKAPETQKPEYKVDEEIKPEKKKQEVREKPKYPSNLKASPMAKRLAEKYALNLAEINGTGPGGRVREKDVYDHLEKGQSKEPEKAEQKGLQLSRMRQTIAERMTYSKQNIPHFYVTYEVDMGNLVKFYRDISKNIDGITYNDIFIKATALNLKKHPEFNSSVKENSVEINEKVNIGVAFAVEDGLLVPVVHDADRKNLKEITEAMRFIKDKVKGNKLKSEDLTGGTFSVSNMGMFGVKEFSAIINPPEAAGLAIGAIMEAPVVKDGEIKIGNTLNLTLSADHRVVDGAKAAIFLRDLKELLENPEDIK